MQTLTLAQANQELVSIASCNNAVWIATILQKRYPEGMIIDSGVMYGEHPVLFHVPFHQHNVLSIINSIQQEYVVNWDFIDYSFINPVVVLQAEEVKKELRVKQREFKFTTTKRTVTGADLNERFKNTHFIPDALYHFDLNDFKHQGIISSSDAESPEGN